MAARRQDCSICMDSFKNPKLLSCHHSFCCKCLEDHVNTTLFNGEFNCPLCRCKVALPVGGVSAFQTNFYIDSDQCEKFPCDICGPKGVACRRCLDCEENLCQSCCYVHEKSKSSRHHKISDLGTLEPHLKCRIQQRIFCDKHKEEEIKIFCKDCKALICFLCKVTKHEHHAIESVPEAAAQMKEDIQIMMNVFSDKIRRLTDSKRETEAYYSNIKDAERREIQALEEQRLQLIKLIVEEVEKMTYKIQNVYEDLRLQNAGIQRGLMEELKTFSIENHNARQILDHGTDIDVIKKGVDLEQIFSMAANETVPKLMTRMEKDLFTPVKVNVIDLIPLIGTMRETTEISLSSASQVSVPEPRTSICLHVGNELRPVPSKLLKNERLCYIALFDCDAMKDDELSFKKGDRLEVHEEASPGKEWVVATHPVTERTGYIPLDYVSKDDNSLQAQDWWNNLDRKEADMELLLPSIPTGTFLVREAGVLDKDSFMLSVRDCDQDCTHELNDACVKHYRILQLDNGDYYISPTRTFRNMLDLIQHYQSSVDGLCCQLLHSYPKVLSFEELEIPSGFIKLQMKLGSGGFGDIYAGTWRNTVDVTVVTVKHDQIKTKEFLRGAELMHNLRHRNIMQLLAVCTIYEPIWIITKPMVHGLLLEYLREDNGKRIRLEEICDMAAQIADGMAYLETLNIVHRDLKAGNLLVGEKNEVKISNFCMAILTQEDIHEDKKFPLKWTAPEAAFGRKFTIKSDVWSFGVLLYELVSFGKVPYPGMTNTEVISKVKEGYRMPKPTGGPVPVPEAYYDTMLKCWDQVPESRPTFTYLHDFFNTFFIAVESDFD